MFKIKINPLWIVLLFILSYFDNMHIIIMYFIFLLLHEMGHMYMARFLGYKFDTIDFMPYGLGLKTNTTYISVKNDILISIAGPIVNLTFIILIVVLWWAIPISYYYTKDMFYINISILILNVLPIFPLDGGRVIMVLIKDRFKTLAVHIMKWVTACSIILLYLLFVLSIFTTLNITYFILAVFLFLSYEGVEFEMMLYLLKDVFDKDYTYPLELKTFVVMEGVDKQELIKKLSSRYMAKFVIVGKSGSRVVTEKDLVGK